MILILLFVLFAILLILNVPIAVTMGTAGLFTLMVEGEVPLIIVLQKLFTGMNNFSLLAIPFFMFAGKLMESGGLSIRLVNFAKALVGHLKGGLGMVSVVASMIFAGISGSAAADTAAVGSILIPAMKRSGYKKGFVASLQACAGTIGPIIPPSILMIIYGCITELSIGKMFLAGIIPGIMIGLSLMLACYIYAIKEGMKPDNNRVSFKMVLKTFKDAVWALIMPVLIIGGILTGITTATEAGMIAVLYGLFVGFFVYKELKLKDLPKLLIEAGTISASILFIAGFASIFGWILARNHFPIVTINFLTSLSQNPYIIILIIIAFFLIIGCFVETFAAMIMFVPVLQPIVANYGFDPIHFALIIIITLMIGQVTPPVGVLLFITTQIAKVRIGKTIRYIGTLVIFMVIALIIIAYSENLVMFIPRLLMD